MQPYFFPYAGYYRIFAAADLVVLFDCVQFPRRGYVHRNQLRTAGGTVEWLTLPLEKADRDVRIADLRFRAGAEAELRAAMRRFPVLEKARAAGNPLFERAARVTSPDVTAYLADTIGEVNRRLALGARVIRSSELAIDPALRAQDRIIAIASVLGARRYINPSGGRELYDAATFAGHGIDLQFFRPYNGSYDSMLQRLLLEPAGTLRDEIVAQCTLEA